MKILKICLYFIIQAWVLQLPLWVLDTVATVQRHLVHLVLIDLHLLMSLFFMTIIEAGPLLSTGKELIRPLPWMCVWIVPRESEESFCDLGIWLLGLFIFFSLFFFFFPERICTCLCESSGEISSDDFLSEMQFH